MSFVLFVLVASTQVGAIRRKEQICCPPATKPQPSFCGGDPDIRCCPNSERWACNTGFGDYWCPGDGYVLPQSMGIPCFSPPPPIPPPPPLYSEYGPIFDPPPVHVNIPEDNQCILPTTKPPVRPNPCEGADPKLPNKECIAEDIKEQSGVNVSRGYQGGFDSSVQPILEPYYTAGLCPVNVHWHLGAEHYSANEYDEYGTGPTPIDERRRLAGKVRQGFQCNLYTPALEMFTKPYHWKHCTDMEVGQTYEVHWPHSALGACGTPNQYQTPFADGVFCMIDKLEET